MKHILRRSNFATEQNRNGLFKWVLALSFILRISIFKTTMMTFTMLYFAQRSFPVVESCSPASPGMTARSAANMEDSCKLRDGFSLCWHWYGSREHFRIHLDLLCKAVLTFPFSYSSVLNFTCQIMKIFSNFFLRRNSSWRLILLIFFIHIFPLRMITMMIK